MTHEEFAKQLAAGVIILQENDILLLELHDGTQEDGYRFIVTESGVPRVYTNSQTEAAKEWLALATE